MKRGGRCWRKRGARLMLAGEAPVSAAFGGGWRKHLLLSRRKRY